MLRSLLVAALAVDFSQAATISFTEILDTWDSGQIVSFGKFDSSMGTLSGVRLNAAAQVGRIMDLSGIPLTPLGMQATIENDFAIYAGMSGATGSYLYHDWGYWPYSAAVRSFSRPASIIDTTMLSIPLSNSWLTDLSRFTTANGTQWNIMARGWTQTYLCSPISACDGLNSLRNLSMTVSYDYVPTVSTPEPRWSAAMVLVAMIAAGWLHRRLKVVIR